VLVNDPAQDYGNEQNTQSETAVIAFGNTVVAAFVDSNLGVVGYGTSNANCGFECPVPTNLVRFTGWAVSRDGGLTFSDKGAPPTNSTVIDPNYIFGSTAGDQVLAYDTTSNIVYLLGNPKRPSVYTQNGTNYHYAPLWRSMDNGQTFLPPTNAVPGLIASLVSDLLDKPAIAVDNFHGQGQGNVYLAYYLTNKIVVYRSGPGGVTWQYSTNLGTSAFGAQVAVGPTHEVYLVWRRLTESFSSIFDISKSTNLGTNFSDAIPFLTNNFPGFDLGLRRSNTSPPEDSFRTPILAILAANPVTNHLYVVYNDTPPNVSTNAGIYFIQSMNGGTNWSSPIQVNSDNTTTDQWQPVITVKPDGTKVFIAWYDRRNDPATNSLIQTFGVFADLPIAGTNSFVTNFPISAVQFPPVFTGTNRAPGSYDPAYPPSFDDPNRCCESFGGAYAGHMGDYDAAVSDNVYVYYVWGDNRDLSSATIMTRKQPNVRFIRLSWPH
jgi:hypothetical protein